MKVITDGSVWIFDEDAKILTRFPKNGEGSGADRSGELTYEKVGAPMPYVDHERGIFHGHERFKVVYGDGPKDYCYTGRILEVIE